MGPTSYLFSAVSRSLSIRNTFHTVVKQKHYIIYYIHQLNDENVLHIAVDIQRDSDARSLHSMPAQLAESLHDPQ